MRSRPKSEATAGLGAASRKSLPLECAARRAMTINGTDNASEVVVMGGHLDSINMSGNGETSRSPGADDDASGVASLTEAVRAM